MADKHNIIYGILKTQKEVYKLVKDRVSIGRNRNSQIVINNNTVSKDHAIIEFDEDYNATLKDLNSSNGTYVNGERLKFMPVKLKTGDKITFGKEKTEYIFESFNMNCDSKTEADMNQYMINGNSMSNNENKMIYDQKINLVNENEISFARMNHFQNNNNLNMNKNNQLNNNYNNGSYINNLRNGNNNNRNYYNEEEDNYNYPNNEKNTYNNLETSYKNKIDELEKRTTELENEKEDLINKNNELNNELNNKNTELKKMTTLFDELNEEYSKLNNKYNALMKYSSDIQNKLDLANIELSQIKKKCHGNEETDKIINEKDNIISILQNEVNYYKKQCGKSNAFKFNTFPENEMSNTNYTINNKLDNLMEKYFNENKKLKQRNETLKKKVKMLQSKGNNMKNIDFAQFETQINYQIDNFNNIINDYNERLSDSLNKVSELFEQSKKEEAAKYLVEQVNDFMKENQRLISENAKLNVEILELQSQLNAQKNVNINTINQMNNINDEYDNDVDIDDNEEEIDELKNKIDELENTVSQLKLTRGMNNDNNFMNINQGVSGNNVREAFINALNQLKEKDILINDLQNKIKENINNNFELNNNKNNNNE